MTSNINGVMLQGFHWFLKGQHPDGRNLWRFLKDEADNLRNAGFYAVWGNFGDMIQLFQTILYSV